MHPSIHPRWQYASAVCATWHWSHWAPCATWLTERRPLGAHPPPVSQCTGSRFHFSRRGFGEAAAPKASEFKLCYRIPPQRKASVWPVSELRVYGSFCVFCSQATTETTCVAVMLQISVFKAVASSCVVLKLYVLFLPWYDLQKYWEIPIRQ